MRKRIIPSADEANPTSDDNWLDSRRTGGGRGHLRGPENPIESALLPGGTSGWRASGPGEQTIRLLFTQPQTVRRILLEFVEPAVERTQEFVLRWSLDGRTLHDVVRQQWNFSPKAPPSRPRTTESNSTTSP